MGSDQKKESHTLVIVISCFAALGGLTFGYGTAVVSGAMLQIRYLFKLNTIWHESIVSVTLAAAALASVLSGGIVDRFGRKPAIMLSSCLYVLGSAVLTFAPMGSKISLLIGRIVTGFGIGCSTMAVPLYMAEVAPTSIRGTLLTLYALFVTTGILLSSIIAGAFSLYEETGWRYMFGIGTIPGIIQFLVFIGLPETPFWLVAKEKPELARATLDRIRQHKDNEEEFCEIQQTAENMSEKESFFLTVKKMLKQSSTRKALLLGCVLQLYQQFCGINSVIYYSGSILRMSGFSSKLAIWLECIPFAVNVTFTCVGVYAVDKLGRRILALLSLSGLVVSSVILGVAFQLGESNSPQILMNLTSSSSHCQSAYRKCSSCVADAHCGYCWKKDVGFNHGICLQSDVNTPEKYSMFVPNTTLQNACSKTNTADGSFSWGYDFCPTKYSWIAVLGLAFFVLAFAPGIGPLSWTINSEIYPQWARGTGISIATSIKWLANLAVSMTFLTLTEHITTYGTFYLYAGISASGIILLYYILPETKGKSLKEVEELFQGKRKKTTIDNGHMNEGFENTRL